ncbi:MULTISPECIES: hypothetical protein [Streptomyces]|uniref:hypothetical protein n=1 Tax=Streptomyces diastaticus group TaxID=2849069 RepID=UPI0013C58B87|nr:hypothetical protein [Streptomyces rutgersensis]GFH66230.1 hypothetical protein Srut_27440 [Streptomyces rutgersensis]
MGWTVLYLAFGIVALWLLGEVLLQYKARLRWRLLAFGGFSLVVLGVLTSLVVVIALGAIAFAVGQTFVTLSFRRGFSTGWAVGGRPGESRRRRTKQRARQEPTLEVSGLQEETPVPDTPPASAEPPPLYAPLEPMPDATGQYGVHGDDPARPAPHASGYETPYAAQESGYAPQDPYAAAQSGYDYDYASQQQYGYDTGHGQGQYTGHAEPYAADAGYPAPRNGYDDWNGQQAQDAYGYPQDNASTGAGYTDTPPGGVWVPQQRDGGNGYDGYGGGHDASGHSQQQPDGAYGQRQGHAQWQGYEGQEQEQPPAPEQGTPDHGGRHHRY